MRSTPSLSSLPGPVWPGVVALDRVLSMGQIELICVLRLGLFNVKPILLEQPRLIEIRRSHTFFFYLRK